MKKELSKRLKGYKALDGGETQVIERGGKPVFGALQIADPFKPVGCRYNKDCLVKSEQDCCKVNCCYRISCETCNEVIQTDEQSNDTQTEQHDHQTVSRPPAGHRARWTAGRRRARVSAQYIGQSGRSMHARSHEHIQAVDRKDKKNALYKHILHAHKDQPQPKFVMEQISSHKTNLHRLISEGIYIEKESEDNPNSILNSRSEWGRTKLVRINPNIQYS